MTPLQNKKIMLIASYYLIIDLNLYIKVVSITPFLPLFLTQVCSVSLSYTLEKLYVLSLFSLLSVFRS